MEMIGDPTNVASDPRPQYTQYEAVPTSPLVSSSEYGLTKFLDPLSVPPVIRAADTPDNSVSIKMQPAFVKLHSQLPATLLWTYNGTFPGPTIEVRSGCTVHVTWDNSITGTFPVSAVDVSAREATAGPGRDGAGLRPEVATLPPWTVTHLHGTAAALRDLVMM